MKALKALLVVLVLGGASLASAEPDAFFVGNGTRGFGSVNNPTSPRTVLNKYAKVTAPLNVGDESISFDSSTTSGDPDVDFSSGDLVLVLQTASVTDLGNGNSLNLDTVDGGKIGRWEFARIESVGTSVLGLKNPLINAYNKDRTQIILVPEYSSLYISAGNTVAAAPWDGDKGGVVVLLVRDILINNGTISASDLGAGLGAGFRGARTYGTESCPGTSNAGRGEGLDVNSLTASNTRRANAGGGGSCSKAGGGGGGNAGEGGVGDGRPSAAGGAEGARIDYANITRRLILGGGGGAGHVGSAGGSGGGVIFIRTGSMFGEGAIVADGLNGGNSTATGGGGGGGGGAGGTIILRVAHEMECPTLSAKGGDGGDTSEFGAGGGGGGGRIFFQAQALSACAPGHVSGGTVGDTTGTNGGSAGEDGVFIPLDEAFAPPVDAVVVSPIQNGLVNTKRPVIEVGLSADAPADSRVFIRFNSSEEWKEISRDGSGNYVGSPDTDLDETLNTVWAVAEYQGLRGRERPSTFTVDITPLDTAITHSVSNPTTSDTARFFFGPDNAVRFECQFNGAADWTSCARYMTYATPDQQEYTLHVRSVDLAGNKDGTPATYQWVVDRTPPTTTLDCSSLPEFTNASMVSFTPGSDDGVLYECALHRVEAGVTEPVACSASSVVLSKSSYPDGKYTFMARGIDAAGNADPTPAACSWTWDTGAPVVSFADPVPPETTNSPSVVFHFHVSDALDESVTYECSLNGAAFALCPNPHTVEAGRSTVEHVLRVRATDRALNTSDTISHFWFFDEALPVPEVNRSDAAGNPTNSLTAAFSFKLQGRTEIPEGTEFYYILNDGTTNDVSKFTKVEDGKSLVLSLSSAGNYTIRVMAYDKARNTYTPRDLQDVYSWEVDLTPPDIEIVSKPAEWERFTKANFEFFAPNEDRINGFRCAISNCLSSVEPSDDCTGTWLGSAQTRSRYRAESGIIEGQNCITVWAQDLATNLSAESETYSWNVDTSPPAPPVITSFQGQLTVATRFPFVEGTAEPFAEVTLLLDNGTEPVARAVANEQGRWRTQFTQEASDGSHNLRAQASDRALNPSELSGVITLLVDSKTPARVVGGGLSCSASGSGGALLALLGLAGLLFQGGRRRRG